MCIYLCIDAFGVTVAFFRSEHERITIYKKNKKKHPDFMMLLVCIAIFFSCENIGVTEEKCNVIIVSNIAFLSLPRHHVCPSAQTIYLLMEKQVKYPLGKIYIHQDVRAAAFRNNVWYLNLFSSSHIVLP